MSSGASARAAILRGLLLALSLWCGGAEGAAAGGETLNVTGVAFSERASAGAALGSLLRAALGGRARVVPPPPECAAPDAAECAAAVLRALAGGALQAALLPAGEGALPAGPRLREAGLEALGALSPAGAPPRRACWATGALRSLAELADEARAERYAAPTELVAALAPSPRYYCGGAEGEGAAGGSARACRGGGATALVGPESEARLLGALAAAHGLRLHAAALGAAWRPEEALRRLRAADTPALLCGRDLDAAPLLAGGARALGPPPCDRADCPFDARPLLKLAATRDLAALRPPAVAALDRLRLEADAVRALERSAGTRGAEEAARAALAGAGGGRGARREVRAAVLVPLGTARALGSARALRAAAELAEADAEADAGAEWRYKVEVADAGCGAAGALRYVTGALCAEYHTLSAAFGGWCGAALAGVARAGGALALPTVWLAWREVPQETSAGAALLAAGDGADGAEALAAVVRALGWRRCAVLSEAGALAPGQAARLGAAPGALAALPSGEADPAPAAEAWARSAASLGLRVSVVAAEDARAGRAALCALAAARLTARDGAAVLLAGPLAARGPHWTREGAECARRAAEGALALVPEWAARWREGGGDAAWTARWRARAGAEAPAEAPAEAALLYDALRLWAAALARLLAAAPDTLDDLHRSERVAALLEQVTGANYSGVTGAWQWAGRARGGDAGAVRLEQWGEGGARAVGRWARGGGLALDAAALRWGTRDGRAPDDGEPRCVAGLPCALAGWLAAAAAMLAAGAALAAGAWLLRRRAARDHRRRLADFGMRAMPDDAAPDRWELPRSRVVINRKLGAGAFGAVYGGHALLGAEGGRAWLAVAVKTLKPGASTEEKLDFLSEAEAMKRFSHARVVRLLGVVTRSEPVCTVMEYMLYGDLKSYLVARRHLAGAGAEVAPARLTAMARDAAAALAYLARRRYVHRDVAARNCLVDAARRVKLADFGMTRVVFDKDYYRFGRKGMLPVRWMAPESLAQGVFSPASDVWSFGVLLYEIVTFGALPYRGLSNAAALAAARAGRGPPLPPALDMQLEALVRSCWRLERRARPTAAALEGFLAEWPRLLTPCLAAPDELASQGRWASWAAPTSAGTDSTYLSAETAAPRAEEADWGQGEEEEDEEEDPFLPRAA